MSSVGKSSSRISKLRIEYLSAALDARQVSRDPQMQLTRWLDAAIASKLTEPHAMTLATVDLRKRPHARVVLLRGIERKGLVFYTNYQSAKGIELAANPHGTLVFFWAELERQVRVEGKVSRVSAKQSDRYFATRPRASQLGAWASKQSAVVSSREALDEAFAQAEHRFRGKAVPRPPHWGGYVLAPVRYEFWQGQRSRLHDRVCYLLLRNGRWTIERLYP